MNHDEMTDLANKLTRDLIKGIGVSKGSTPEIMAVLNMVQVFTVKSVLDLIGDPDNSARADSMIEFSAVQAKEAFRSTKARAVN